MAKQISVSIGIAAYNEEVNIKNLLHSVLLQKQINYFIREIIVITDGSTDKTFEMVKEIRNKKINILEEKVRKGQNLRYNSILKQVKGDVVVFLEADTILKNDNYLSELLKPIIKDKNVSLTYGSSYPIPVSGGLFFERMLTFVETLKQTMLVENLDNDNLYFCGSGKALVRKSFANFSWPLNVPEDTYIYLYAKQNRLKMLHRPSAVIYFKSPANFLDYARKTSRFNNGRNKIQSYFSNEVLADGYKFPKKWLWMFLVKGFQQKPIYMSVYIFANLLTKIYKIFAAEFNPMWEISHSTKRLKITK